MNWAGNSPPDAGGVDATSRRSREASVDGADGVVKDGTFSKERIPKHFGNPNHPVCAAAVASHLFLDGAATPPMPGGELPASHSLTPFIDRASSTFAITWTASSERTEKVANSTEHPHPHITSSMYSPALALVRFTNRNSDNSLTRNRRAVPKYVPAPAAIVAPSARTF